MKKFLTVLTIFWCLTSSLAKADDAEIMRSFYIHKDCNLYIREILAKLDRNNQNNKDFNYGNSQVIIGLTSGIFMRDTGCGSRILAASNSFSQYTKVAILTSLLRANLQDAANKYARQVNYPLRNLGNVLPVNNVIPKDNPADNDLLLGAYYASGDNFYLNNMLNGYKTAKILEIKDAIRVALVMSRSGPSLTIGSRQSAMPKALAKRYNAGQGTKDVMRILTMSSALWSLNSLAVNDKNLQDYLRSFLSDPRLAVIYSTEFTNFSNYLNLLNQAANGNRIALSKISDYEELR